jgi:hypothetical protein
MSVANVFRTTPLPRLPAAASPLLQRWAGWLLSSIVPDAEHHTRDSAASLYARAARYEATQPGFAADLRAAAEAMQRPAPQRRR